MYSIHHFTLSVSDAKKSEEFYSLLGFEKIKEWKAEDNSLQIVHLKNGEIILELFCYTSYQGLPDHSKVLSADLSVLGVKHFALHVESIEKAREDLSRKGVTFHTDIVKGRIIPKYFFIQDPDGILIEIVSEKE
jgi:glyoxylase I family protein